MLKNDNNIMQVTSSYVALTRDLDMPVRSILSALNITAMSAISSDSLKTHTIYPVGDKVTYKSDTDTPLLDIGFDGGKKLSGISI